MVLTNLSSMISLQFNQVIHLFPFLQWVSLTQQYTFANPYYILIKFHLINLCFLKVEFRTLTTPDCLTAKQRHVTHISQSDVPKKNELGSEQCEEAAAHWETYVMIKLVSLQDWQWHRSCHLVLNVIGAEFWWQQEREAPTVSWALFLAVKLDPFCQSLPNFSMSYLLSIRNSFLI